MPLTRDYHNQCYFDLADFCDELNVLEITNSSQTHTHNPCLTVTAKEIYINLVTRFNVNWKISRLISSVHFKCIILFAVQEEMEGARIIFGLLAVLHELKRWHSDVIWIA